MSGEEIIKMVVNLSGGSDSRIQCPFMVFKNRNRGYPNRGTTYNVVGVAYRTARKEWMDSTVMPQWSSKNRVISAIPNNQRWNHFVDN